MPYILRFVQRYRPMNRAEFMALEARFAEMEKRRDDLPLGRRSQPYAGREPSNTLIWDCEFASLEEAEAALARLSADPEHDDLFGRQVPYMEEAFTEIYEVLEFD